MRLVKSFELLHIRLLRFVISIYKYLIFSSQLQLSLWVLLTPRQPDYLVIASRSSVELQDLHSPNLRPGMTSL